MPRTSSTTAAPPRPQDSVGYLIKQVLSSIRRQADAQLAEHDLTYAQWLPLYRLATEPGHTAATLAREMDLDPPTVTRALDRLEAKGLLRRERSTEDRRVLHLVATAEGKRAAARVPEVLRSVVDGHLSDFSAAERQALLQMLRRMLANGEAHRLAQAAESP